MKAPTPLAAILEWDVATWSQALPFWELHLPKDLTGMAALEIGGRRGGLSLFLALRGAQVVCSDLEDPWPQAQPTHQRHGVSGRIQYQAADATKLPFPDGQFHLVVFKSVLGALETAERQDQAFAEIHRVLKPGGWVLFAENLTASPLHALARRLFLRWARYWRYVRREEIQAWCQPFSELHLASAGVLAAWGRSERQRGWLAKLDHRCPFPPSWHYALFGVARK